MSRAAPLSDLALRPEPLALCLRLPLLPRDAEQATSTDQLTEPLAARWRTLRKAPSEGGWAHGSAAGTSPGPSSPVLQDQGGRTYNSLNWVNPTFYKWYPEIGPARTDRRPSPASVPSPPRRRRLRVCRPVVPQLEWLLWRGAIWCYATYVLVTLPHPGPRMPLLCSPWQASPLGTQFTVFVATPSPRFRYMAAPMFIGVLCLSLIPALRGDARPVVPPPASRATSSTTSDTSPKTVEYTR